MKRIQRRLAVLLSAVMVAGIGPQTVFSEELGSGMDVVEEYDLSEEISDEEVPAVSDADEITPGENGEAQKEEEVISSGEADPDALEEVVEGFEVGEGVVIDEAAAALLNEGVVQSGSGYWINPLYADLYSEEDLPQVQAGIPQVGAGTYIGDKIQLSAIYRNAMVQRKTSLRLNIQLVKYNVTLNDINNFINDIFWEAFKETESAKEGDYLRCHTPYASWYSNYTQSGKNCYVVCDITTTYYTNSSQERSVDSKVNSLKSQFNRKTTQLSKVCAIYDYVCTHVTYVSDYRLNNGSDTLKYTAYDALINGESVCQGYAGLIYRLMRECGISCRVVAEQTNINHSWNIVKVGTSYYYVDATWDADYSSYANVNRLEYPYFLRGSSDFNQSRTITFTKSGTRSMYVSTSSHYLSTAYLFSKFNTKSDYPIAYYHYTTSTAVSYAKLYRLFNPNSGEHFYTASEEERDQLITKGWKYEPKQGWYIPTSGVGAAPVYRLYNPRRGYEEHHYTMDVNEKNVLVRRGWNYEGIAFYSDPRRGVPIYRMFNNRLKSAASHHYTADFNEYFTLVYRQNAGWKSEGICWYGVKVS